MDRAAHKLLGVRTVSPRTITPEALACVGPGS